MGKYKTARQLGLNPRALGTNLRALGLNPKALGTNPKALRENVCMKIELTVRQQKTGEQLVEWVEWTVYEDQEAQYSGAVVNRRMTVEDMLLTALGDIFRGGGS